MSHATDMFLRKIGELFLGLPNVFVIADDILIAGLDDQGKDHDATLDKVLRICMKANLNLNRENAFSDAPALHFMEKSYCGMVWAQTLEKYRHY